MKNTIWVFKEFGFRNGMRYVYDSLTLGVRRFLSGETIPTVATLTDEELTRLAEAFDPAPRIVHQHDETIN